MPIFQALPGFQRYFVIVDHGNTVLSISIFDDQDAADVATEYATDWAQRYLGDQGVVLDDTLTGWAVVDSEMKAPALMAMC